jgi:hypothetical protein
VERESKTQAFGVASMRTALTTRGVHIDMQVSYRDGPQYRLEEDARPED